MVFFLDNWLVLICNKFGDYLYYFAYGQTVYYILCIMVLIRMLDMSYMFMNPFPMRFPFIDLIIGFFLLPIIYLHTYY